MPYDNANQVVDELFESLLSMIESNFIFDSVQLLYYKYRKINFTCGGSYIDSPVKIKTKKATINPKSDNDKCLQYAVLIALNFEEIKKNPQKFSNTKPFINNYNWEKISYLSKIANWKRFEKNNLTIALNILYIKDKEICPDYSSKINSNCEKKSYLNDSK